MKPTMHIELVKMSQFFARAIGNEDKKFVGLNKQVKTEIGLRIFEEYGLAQLVEKRPFDPFWRPTKKLIRDLKTADIVASKAQSESGCSFAFITGSFKGQGACSGHPFVLAAAA